MEPKTRLLIIGSIAIISLFWGIRDLMRKREETTLTLRVQSWAQVAAGLIGLGFVISYLVAK